MCVRPLALLPRPSLPCLVLVEKNNIEFILLVCKDPQAHIIGFF